MRCATAPQMRERVSVENTNWKAIEMFWITDFLEGPMRKVGGSDRH